MLDPESLKEFRRRAEESSEEDPLAGGTMFVATGNTTVNISGDIDAATAVTPSIGSIISLRLPL